MAAAGRARPSGARPQYDAALSRTYLASPRNGCAGGAGARTGDFPSRCTWKLSGRCRSGTGRIRTRRRRSTGWRVGRAWGWRAMGSCTGRSSAYNNLLDLSAALGLLLEFEQPAAVVIKHTNPCGAAVGATVGAAMARAKASDPVSIYGGIVGVNRAAGHGGGGRARAGSSRDPLRAGLRAGRARGAAAQRKKKCRVLQVPCERRAPATPSVEYRSVLGGLLAQTSDTLDVDESALRVVTRRAPTDEEMAGLRFAWRVAKHVKSQRHRAGHAGAGGRGGRGPDEPARLRAPGGPACPRGRALDARAASAPPTPSSRSATAWTRWPGRA